MTFIAPHYWKKKMAAPFNFLKRDLYLVKTPGWLRAIYPDCTWRMPPGKQTLYLSFDDGPHPQITPFVLDMLRQYQAKATFFCIGKNVVAYPAVYQRILEEGHATGNHTFNHINGWKSTPADYLADVAAAAPHIQSRLFRPPYGRIKRKQISGLRSGSGAYRIIMWDVLAGDWDAHMRPEKCFRRVCSSIKDGSVIVFHDSEKAYDRMSYALPRVLEHFSKLGYKFDSIQ